MSTNFSALMAFALIALTSFAQPAFAQTAIPLESRVDVNTAAAVPVPLGPFPGTFSGRLPCASCEGIDYTLTLLEDHAFFLSMRYLGVQGPDQFNDMGRWVMSSFGNVLVLKGQRPQPLYFKVQNARTLVHLTEDARPILSKLNYRLLRTDNPPPLDLELFPLQGQYTYFADAGRFTECVSGLQMPVMQTGRNAQLEADYLALGQPPQTVARAVLFARITPEPAMEGDQKAISLHPLRVEEVAAQPLCESAFKAHPVGGTQWVLQALGTNALEPGQTNRIPDLKLDPEQGRFSGNNGCNQMVGSVELNGNRIAFSAVAATRMACMQGGDIEQQVMDALGKATRWNVLGDRLELLDNLGRRLAWFVAQP